MFSLAGIFQITDFLIAKLMSYFFFFFPSTPLYLGSGSQVMGFFVIFGGLIAQPFRVTSVIQEFNYDFFFPFDPIESVVQTTIKVYYTSHTVLDTVLRV